MSNDKFLKITYHGVQSNQGGKLNAYLKMPSPTYAVLLREIAICLFEQRKLPRTEFRTYWIDTDNDEIDIIDQCDYEIFMNKRNYKLHLQVAPIIEGNTSNDNNSTKTGGDGTNVDPSAFVIHERVECDACENGPIVGFRYKCIQCPNFDLCERCEAQHKHSEHMMVRMPNENCPSVVEAWVTGRSGRRHKRAMGGTCPFVATPAMNFCGTPPTAGGADVNGTPGGKQNSDGAKDRHGRHAHKHHRRHMQNGIFAHLYNMMHDLAEGGGPVAEATAAAAAEAAKAANNVAHEATTAAANAAHIAAHEAAVAAAAAANAGAAAAAAFTTATESSTTTATEASTTTATEQQQKSTGAVPKTPPSTPKEDAPTAEEPIQTKATETNIGNAIPQQKQTTTTTEGVPQIGSPILENVAQFVDPQYMKAGIQILNNFSEMFAKMLDPMDGSIVNGGAQCPFQAAAFPPQHARKSSASSTTSSNTSTSTNASAGKENEKSEEQTPLLEIDENAAQQVGIAPPAAFMPTSEEKNETSPLISMADSTPNQTPERRRSQSEENDWQLIDNQTLAPLASTATPISSDVSQKADAATATPTAATNAQQTQTVQIDYEQLSKDLRAHIAEEKEKEEAAKSKASNNPFESPATAAATAAIAREEEKAKTPIYHTDPKINKAVLSMMAMGFSNEGAWLTQLLESVNGSIPQALDLMSAAQRNAQ